MGNIHFLKLSDNVILFSYFCDTSAYWMQIYSKTRVKRPLSKRPNIGFKDQLLLNADQKYCRMLQGEHSAILLTFTMLPFFIKIFVLSVLHRFYCT